MFVSVLTPTYNRANKLHRVYESIKSQTLKKIDGKYIFEWIIVDDGSNDNTKELVKKWQKEVDWKIVYKHQKNQGKPHAIINGLKSVRGKLTLIADSDDRFLDDTFETFYNIWISFSEKEKAKLGGIGVLCQDQFGNRIGCDFPVVNKFVSNVESFCFWDWNEIGEIWAALKTENLKYAFLEVENKIKQFKFIPESYFWSRITFGLNRYSYHINKVLRIYYKDTENSLVKVANKRFIDGFIFESKECIRNYKYLIFKCPKVYFKHLLKFIYYSLIKKGYK